MSYNSARVYNGSATTGNANTLGAGSVITGASLLSRKVQPGTLSALVTVTAETDTITMLFKWQVSNDNSTFVDIVPQQNPANVILATGTAGADAAVSKVFSAPREAYAWQYVRGVIVTGVATGATTDLYSIGYCYLKQT